MWEEKENRRMLYSVKVNNTSEKLVQTHWGRTQGHHECTQPLSSEYKNRRVKAHSKIFNTITNENFSDIEKEMTI